MTKGSNVIVKRLGRVIHEGKLKTLKNVKADVQEMVAMTECGIQVKREMRRTKKLLPSNKNVGEV